MELLCIANIIEESIAYGLGVRFVVFAQGVFITTK